MEDKITSPEKTRVNSEFISRVDDDEETLKKNLKAL